MSRQFAWVWLGLALLAGLFVVPPVAGGADDPDDPEPPSLWPKTVPAHRARSSNNLKQIAIAFHSFHDVHGAFPASAITDKNGKALLSWRVALLPYLEEDNLYKEFKLDEPWDSKHNKKLLEKMPQVYAPTITGKPAKPYTTFYQVFTGPGTMFDPKRTRGTGIGTLGSRLADVTDGLSYTVLATEAAEPVLWTKP